MQRSFGDIQQGEPCHDGTRAATVAALALTAMFALAARAPDPPSPDQEPDESDGEEYAESIVSAEADTDVLADRGSFVAQLTAYSHESCTTRGCLTRSETRTRWGIVAVDPDVVPLGSRLAIEGFEGQVFVAEDTGRGVQGVRVDVWLESTSEAVQFGVQHRKVMVL
jgi:3D (Asp-Asp-Asp) domain-containing protein